MEATEEPRAAWAAAKGVVKRLLGLSGAASSVRSLTSSAMTP